MYGKELKENDIGMVVEVKVQGLTIDYIMQLVMRMLDLILIQVLGSLQGASGVPKITKEDAENMLKDL